MHRSTFRRLPLLAAVLLLAFSRPSDEPGVKLDSQAFGEIKARAIGPAVMSGRITTIDVVNSNPRIMYIGSASGGLWKSTSGGVTFEPIFDKYTQSIGHLTIDQVRPDTVWVGTGEHCTRNSVSVGTGLYKTTNGGESWQFMGLAGSERISDILINPRDPNIVYVAVVGHLWGANEERGVFKTSDGGKTWEKVLYVDANTGCASLAMDPQEPDILYAGMWDFRRTPYSFRSGGPGSGLYKSTDGGKTWAKKQTGLPEGELGRITIAVAPSRANIVYAVVEAAKTALYRSDDLGESWAELNSSQEITVRPFYFGHLYVDPSNYNRVYKPGLYLGVSNDGGKSFTNPITSGGRNYHPDLHAMWINPSNTSHLLIGTDGGVYESLDRGSTWRHFRNLPVSQFYRISYDMQNPYNVYGGLQDNGSWMGPSSSRGGILNRDWENLGGGDGFYVFPDPKDDDIVYLESQGGNIMRRHRSTNEVKSIVPYPKPGEAKYRFNWNTPIAFSPTNAGVMYLGAQYLLRSSDRGESWQTISPDLTTNDPNKQRQSESGGLTIDNSTAENHCTIYTISESPRDAGVVWVGTDDGNLQVTSDGGASWSNVTANLPGLPKNAWCSSVSASNHDRATAYVTFDAHRNDDMGVYVYKTQDLGRTWTSLATAEIEGYCLDIKEDLVNPALLFLGTEFGLFISVDGGQNWARFEGNVPKVAIREIKIHPRDGDVILGTHGRGVMIIDDLTPLRQLTPEMLAAEVAILPARPATISLPSGMQRFDGDGEFRGPNPSEVVNITYYLKKRHLFGDMRIEIYSPTGELIKTLSGGKRRGFNRVPWAMRLDPPRTAQAATLAFGALFGPMVDPGDYTIKLVKGDTTYQGSYSVIFDPRYPHSEEDRRLQQRTVMKLYRMQEHLAYIAAAVVQGRDQARKHAGDLGTGDGLAKDLTRFAGRLDALHKTLVATRRGGITGEEQLRERVVSLYGSVSSYLGAPTQSQVQRMQDLEGEIGRAEREFQAILTQDLQRLNRRLESKRLAPIAIPTEAEYRGAEEGE